MGSPKRKGAKQLMQIIWLKTQLWQPRRYALLVMCLIMLTLPSRVLWQQIDQNTLRNRGVLRFKVPSRVWEATEAAKARMPKSQQFAGWDVEALHKQLPVWVLSLARASKRRQAVIQELHKAGITNYDIVDAVDGRNASAVSYEELSRYTSSWKRHLWLKRQHHYMAKIAIDLSHYRLLERVVSSNRSAIIIEDDARLTGRQWASDLLRVLQELPEDWDLLYLNAVYTTKGRKVSPHLSVVRETAGTIGYIPSPSFARRVLQAARGTALGGKNGWVDLLFAAFTAHRDAQAYIVEPPLVHYTSVPSTVDYGVMDVNVTSWERFWMRHAIGR